MATYVAGSTITIWVPLIDSAGDPITTAIDADFSESIDHEATNGTLTTATVSAWQHRSNGRYYATISNAQAGKYTGTITYNGTPKQPFTWEADVLTAAQADPAAALADASTGVKASILNATTAGASDGTVLGALLRIGRGTAYVTAPVAETTAIEVRQGDDYLNADGRALEWATDAAGDWPTLTDATVAFTAAHVYGSDTFTKAGTVVTATGATKRVRVELSAAETTGLQSGRWTYELVATLANASVVTLAAHRMSVHERI